MLWEAFDSLAPASSPFGLPVYVAPVPAAPFCETPILNAASDTNDLTTEIAEVTEFQQTERDFRTEGMGFPG
jgi:hypothetical protein